MPAYIYETHILPDRLLPFIFHMQYRHNRHQSPPNWHENIEILYCTEGSGYVQCGIQVFDFSQGDIFVVNTDVPHSIGSEQSVKYRCLIVDNSFCAANGIPVSQLHFQDLIQDPSLADLFEEITAAYLSHNQGDAHAAANIRHRVLGLLLQLWTRYSAPRQPDSHSEADKLIKGALTYIRQHLSESITLDAIADSVGISKYHLSRQFKLFTGKTIIETVNLIRCTEAKRLIEGGMRVSEAAAACGFENLSYFTRTFKKQFHILPSALLNEATTLK